MSNFEIGRAGTGTCRERQYPVYKDGENIGCFFLPKDAANFAKDEHGATEITVFDVDSVESDAKFVITYQDGKWILK
jgi:hypothetical protein